MNYPEGTPSNSEALTVEELAESARQLAETSIKFANAEAYQSRLAFTVVNRQETTIEFGFSAERDTVDDPEDRDYSYAFTLGATQSIERVNHELAEMMREKGDEVPEPEEIGEIEVEYDAYIRLQADGGLTWEVSRTYQVWRQTPEVEDEDSDPEVEGSSEDDIELKTGSDFEVYYVKLECNASFDDDEKSRSTPPAIEAANTAEIDAEFKRMIGELTLDTVVFDAQLALANKIFGYCLIGRDADVDVSQFFPHDVMSQLDEK